MTFYSFDLDSMTLVLKLDLDMVKMYLHTQNEVPSYSISKVIAWTDRQTHTQTDSSEIKHSRMVMRQDSTKHWTTQKKLQCWHKNWHRIWNRKVPLWTDTQSKNITFAVPYGGRKKLAWIYWPPAHHRMSLVTSSTRTRFCNLRWQTKFQIDDLRQLSGFGYRYKSLYKNQASLSLTQSLTSTYCWPYWMAAITKKTKLVMVNIQNGW